MGTRLHGLRSKLSLHDLASLNANVLKRLPKLLTDLSSPDEEELARRACGRVKTNGDDEAVAFVGDAWAAVR